MEESEFYNYSLDYIQRAIHIQHAIQEMSLIKSRDETEKLCMMVATKLLESRRKELLYNGLYPLKENDSTNRIETSNPGNP